MSYNENAIGKGADALEPAFRFLYFQSDFEITFRRFRNERKQPQQKKPKDRGYER